MSLDEAYKNFEAGAEETLAWFQGEAGSLRSGRVSPGIVRDIQVEHYGSRMALPGVASINSLDARTLQISPWDASATAAIQKALTEADLGALPVVDGKIIRLSFALMSEEVRQETVKKLHKKAEEARIRLRQARDEVLTKLTRDRRKGSLTEDDFYNGRLGLNKRIDSANETIEKIVAGKEAEIRTV